MRDDRGYERDFQRGSGRARYDYGLRGWRDTAPDRPPVRVREVGGGYDRGYRGPPFPNRVTQRYNLEYVRPGPNPLRTNYAPYGGDARGRVVDSTGYWRPYTTQGGSRTWRGGGMPLGWEREAEHARYDAGYRGYGRDFYGPMR